MVSISYYSSDKSLKKLPPPSSKEKLNWLKDYVYIGKSEDKENLLRVAFVKEGGKLVDVENQNESTNGTDIYYDGNFGYWTENQP